MTKKTILAIFCLLLSLIIGCNYSENLFNQETSNNDNNTYKVLRITSPSDISTLNSTIATDTVSFEVLGNTMEGLFVLTGGNKLKNGVCESYTISKDGKTYTFKLIKDSVWSNGETVTAHDFVYAWRRLGNRKIDSGYSRRRRGPQYSFMLEIADIKNSSEVIKGEKPIEELGVYAKDDYTLVVDLEHPIPFLPNVLSFPSFLPLNEGFVKDIGEDFGTSIENTLFNGPYKLHSWDQEKEFVYKKNENYWNKNNINIDEIYVKIAKNYDTALEEYEEGHLDYVSLNSYRIDEYSSHDNLISTLDSAMYYLELRHNKEIINNVNARRAIALSIEKSYITDEILGNGSIPADYLIPKGFAISPEGKDFRDTTDTYNQYNLGDGVKYWEKAKEELGIETAKIVLLVYDTKTQEKIAKSIKKQLESNLEGLTVDIAYMQFSGKLPLTYILNENRSSDMSIIDMELSGWGPDYLDPMTFLDMWTTNHELNEWGYSNKRFDSIIESSKNGFLSHHEMIRWIQLQKAERILIEEDVGIIPLYQKGGKSLIKEYVKNWEPNAFSPQRYWGTMDIVE